MVEIARRVLSHTDWLPADHGARPHLTLVTEWDGGSGDTDGDAAEDTKATEGRLGPDGGAMTNGGAATKDGVALDEGGAGSGAGRGRFGRGEPTWGGPLSAATVARIACDAGITWIITDSAGVPLNVGREQRTVTRAQWAALIVRDGGCVFPGCHRGPEWCEAHHIRWWRFGGPTDLANLCLLCAYHHRKVHHDGWGIELGSDGIPEFVPPSWVDAERTHRRNSRPRYHRKRPAGSHPGRGG